MHGENKGENEHSLSCSLPILLLRQLSVSPGISHLVTIVETVSSRASFGLQGQIFIPQSYFGNQGIALSYSKYDRPESHGGGSGGSGGGGAGDASVGGDWLCPHVRLQDPLPLAQPPPPPVHYLSLWSSPSLIAHISSHRCWW